MTTFHRTSCLIAVALCFTAMWSGARAADPTVVANVQRAAAVAIAQQHLGYASIALSDQCCCQTASGNRIAYPSIDQQIEQLSAAIKAPAPYVEPSAAALALGAY